VIVFREVTAIVHAEEQVRAREELVASVSHDLKNPLAVLSLNAELLRRRARDARDRAIADDISRAVAQMDEMVRNLLDFATLEPGRLSTELQSVSVGTLVREAVARVLPLARARGQEITVGDMPAGDVTCSPGRVLQVFSNVLGNAIKFSHSGGRIAVLATREHSAVRFDVRDDGSGISAADLPHVFERFFRGETTAAGTGLGLAIAKTIVEAHGGTIDIASRLGSGTHVAFTLPAAL
jgi:signal transduction histidine kinase